MDTLNQKYHIGDKVVAKEIPTALLTIRRFVDRIYYCRLVSDPESRDRVYFERELTGA